MNILMKFLALYSRLFQASWADIKHGTTAYSEYFRMVTTSGTPFGGTLAGLASGANIASLILAYTRDRSTPIHSLCAALNSEGSAHSGFKAFEIFSGFGINSNRAPGLFRVDVPDSAWVAGVDKVILALSHPAADVAMIRHDLRSAMPMDVFDSVGSLHTRVSSVDVRISSLDIRVSSLDVKVGSLSTKVDSLATFLQVDSLHTRVGSLYARVGEVSAGIPLATEINSKATFTQAADILSRVNSWIGDRGIFVTSGSMPVSGIDSLHTRVSSVDVRVQSVQAQVNSNFVGIGSLQAFVNTNIGLRGIDITSAPGAPATVDYTAIASSVWGSNSAQELKNQITSLDVRVQSAATFAQAADIQTKVNSWIGDRGIFITSGSMPVGGINSLDTRVTSLDVRVQSIGTQVGSLYARVGEVSANVPLATEVNSKATFTQAADIQTKVNSWVGDRGIFITSGFSPAVGLGSLDVRVQSAAAQVNSVFNRTTNLPDDPADQSLIIAATDAVLTSVSSLHTRVGSVDVRVGSEATQVGSLYARVGEVGADTPLAAAVNSKATSVQADSLQVGVNSIYERVALARNDISSVQAQVNSNFTSLGSLHTRVGSVDTRVGSMSTFLQVDSLHTRVGALVGSLSTFLQVDSLHTRIGSLETRIVSLDTRASSLAQFVQANSLQVGVNTLQPMALAGVDISKINSDSNAASNLRRGVLGAIVGQAAESTRSVLSLTNVTPAAGVADQWLGRVLVFDRDTLTTNLRGQATLINSMTATGILNVQTLTTAPVSGDTFAIH